LKFLLDERDIVRAALLYSRALDPKIWDLLGEMFHPDAKANLSSTSDLAGLEAITGRIRKSLPRSYGQRLVLVKGKFPRGLTCLSANNAGYIYSAPLCNCLVLLFCSSGVAALPALTNCNGHVAS
jgi:hypothetical protein